MISLPHSKCSGEDLLAAAALAGWPALYELRAGVDVEPGLLDRVSALGSGTRALLEFLISAAALDRARMQRELENASGIESDEPEAELDQQEAHMAATRTSV